MNINDVLLGDASIPDFNTQLIILNETEKNFFSIFLNNCDRDIIVNYIYYLFEKEINSNNMASIIQFSPIFDKDNISRIISELNSNFDTN